MFTILVIFVSFSQQQRRRAKLQAIRNLDDQDFVQRYEETPPIRPAVRKPAVTRPQARSQPRPATRPRTEAQPAPKPKVEKRLFNVLLRTADGFNEKGKAYVFITNLFSK